MRFVDLVGLYLVVGGACAIALYRRAPEKNRAAWINALVTVSFWPLWAPIVWTARREHKLELRASEVVTRIRAALEEGAESVIGTPLERLLNRESARNIVGEVERVAARRQELLELLDREEFSLNTAERQLATLEHKQAAPRVRASARLHLANVRRLHDLAERDARALEELSGLVLALRTQLVLMRLSGSSGEGVGDIVSELWARIESLSEASDDVLGTVPLEHVV